MVTKIFNNRRSGKLLDRRPRGRGFEPHWHHCVVSLTRHIHPSLVLVQPRKTHPYITERLLMGCKESIIQQPAQLKVKVKLGPAKLPHTVPSFHLTISFMKIHTKLDPL